MAGGKHSSRTFVKRTLVGDPGITYKYLGLRLFAHAWSNPSGKTSRDNDGVAVVPSVMKDIGTINKHMIEMTKSYENHGLCNYNLTLINYMEPTSHNKVGFKDEANYGTFNYSKFYERENTIANRTILRVFFFPLFGSQNTNICLFTTFFSKLNILSFCLLCFYLGV